MFHLAAFALWVAMYFLPSIIGRNKRSFAAIFVLNLFLGWTVIGWIAALVWALTVDSPAVAIQALPSCSLCRTPIRAGQNYCPGCGNALAWPHGTQNLAH